MEGGVSCYYIAVCKVLRVAARALVAETVRTFDILPCAAPPTYQSQVAKCAPTEQHNHTVSLLPRDENFLAALCTVFCWCPDLCTNQASTESSCCYTAVASACPPYQPSCINNIQSEWYVFLMNRLHHGLEDGMHIQVPLLVIPPLTLTTTIIVTSIAITTAASATAATTASTLLSIVVDLLLLSSTQGILFTPPVGTFASQCLGVSIEAT